MNTNELGILRLAVAVGVNVYASRYVARLVGVNPDIGGAVAVGAMLWQSNATPPDNAAAGLLDRAAAILVAPGALVVNALAESTAPELVQPNGEPL